MMSQCSCTGPAPSLPFDKELWTKVVEECMCRPSKRVKKAPGYDAKSNQPIPGFVSLVTNRRSIEPRWLYRWRRGPKALEDDQNYAFSVNLADLQRMHLRLLQGRLTWLALSAGFDKGHGVEQGVLTKLGPTIRDYGTSIRRKPDERSRIQSNEGSGNESILISFLSTSCTRP
jgi:ribosomal protein L39E